MTMPHVDNFSYDVELTYEFETLINLTNAGIKPLRDYALTRIEHMLAMQPIAYAFSQRLKYWNR